MAKAGIITFLHNDNYGSILQAYALEQVLLALQVNSEHLDYAPDTWEKLRNMFRCGNSPSLILEGLHKRSESGAYARHEMMDAFRSSRLKLSARCRNAQELADAASGMDVLIAGSDQIWSPVWLNPIYFLTFANEKPKIAYACSLGVQQLPRKRKRKIMQSSLQGFQSLSVREEEGAHLIEEISGIRPEVMPDPVLLLTPEEWSEMEDTAVSGVGRLVCYMIDTNPAYWERVKRTAEVLELEPLIIPMTDEARRQGWENAEGVTPERFIGLFHTASYVMTDSFHGAMFASIFSRQHTVLRRYEDGDPESKNSRIDQIQRMLGYVSMDACRPDNWTALRISELRKQGLEWLEIALSQAGV
ncbi:MAG: polysaccharide pyruvyl transferase family protein [Clostridia bacterium]|nr:polysaccharide pyruvyl transferase family protein [Clostridia bacterium]